MHISRMMSARALPVVFLIFGAAHLRATVLYDQPTNSFGGFFSQNDTTSGGLGNYATVYDNFTLGATDTIGLVSWVGSYSPPPAGTMTGYTITFYSDAAGAPGGVLYSTGDVAGNANETFLLTDTFSDPTFTYSAPVNFTALAGTQYWMSIVADVADPPGWVWESGTGGDGNSYQNFMGTLSLTGVDEAFTLSTSVPEPASFALMGAGLAVLGMALHRRSGSAAGAR